MSVILNKPPLRIGQITYEIKDGILFVERHVRMNYIVDNLKSNVANRLTYTEGYSYPLIIFGRDMLSMDKSSRDYMVNGATINTLSRAFVVEKSQGKLQLKFFIETNQQPVPTEIFEEMEPAIEWSKQFRLK